MFSLRKKGKRLHKRRGEQTAAGGYQTSPRIRAFGKARIDIARRIKTQQDWDQLWKEPVHTFPFHFDLGWKQCVEYRVDDFAAEVGFLIDLLGLTIHAISPDYAMFTSPNHDFFFSVVNAEGMGQSTPPDGMRMQFSVANLLDTVGELKKRGIVFEHEPQPCEPGSDLFLAVFRTPHGVSIDLLGQAEPGYQPPVQEEMDRPGRNQSWDETGLDIPSFLRSSNGEPAREDHLDSGMLDAATPGKDAYNENHALFDDFKEETAGEPAVQSEPESGSFLGARFEENPVEENAGDSQLFEQQPVEFPPQAAAPEAEQPEEAEPFGSWLEDDEEEEEAAAGPPEASLVEHLLEQEEPAAEISAEKETGQDGFDEEGDVEEAGSPDEDIAYEDEYEEPTYEDLEDSGLSYGDDPAF